MNKEIECETCIKRKTMYCPNSNECLSTEDKPFYQNRIMVLEENQQLQTNWNKLKKYIQEELKDAVDDFAEEDFIKVLDKMQSLERGEE